MIDVLGYNFLGDGNALDPSPTNATPLSDTVLKNGIFNHMLLTKDIADDGADKPTTWLADMIINAAFNGTLAGGTLQDLAGNITGYKIKRRKLGNFDWVTIDEKQVTELGELTFIYSDHLAASLTDYEYAFVPMVGNVEGSYIVESVRSNFNGVFFVDQDNIFKLDANVQFGNTQTTQKIGVYEPFGRRYPVVVSNGSLTYQSGNLSGLVLNEGYDTSRQIDRKAILAQRNLFVNFLNNRQPKILKDWNGQIWLCMVTANPSVEYLQGSGMGLANVNVGWTEIGDADDKSDLYSCGFIPTAD